MDENKPIDALAVATALTAAWLSGRQVLNAGEAVNFWGAAYDGIAAKLSPPPSAPVEPVLTPAVPIRKSVTPDYIICLDDGMKFKSLKRHLRTKFDLTPEAYRERWGLPADYPMVAPNYSAKRSQLAKDNGLGTKGVSR